MAKKAKAAKVKVKDMKAKKSDVKGGTLARRLR